MLSKTRRNSTSLHRVIAYICCIYFDAWRYICGNNQGWPLRRCRPKTYHRVITGKEGPVYQKMKNVSCEHNRLVVRTQLCKLRDTSDTFIGRAWAMFHLKYVRYLWINSTIILRSMFIGTQFQSLLTNLREITPTIRGLFRLSPRDEKGICPVHIICRTHSWRFSTFYNNWLLDCSDDTSIIITRILRW